MKVIFLGVISLLFVTGCMMLPMVGMMGDNNMDKNNTKSSSSHSH